MGHLLMQMRKKSPDLMRRVQARNQQVSMQQKRRPRQKRTQVEKKRRLHSNQSMMSTAPQVPALGRFLHHMTVQQHQCSQVANQMMTNKKYQLTAQRNSQG